MKRSIVLLLLAGVALATPAAAADFPVTKPVTSPVRVQNWTGFYAGVNAGYGWGGYDVDVLAGGTTVASVGFDLDGFLGGGQVGFNIQSGAFVWGGEADIQASWMEGSRTFALPGPIALGIKVEVPWFATARLRAGIANGPSLFYVTGGLIHAKGEATATLLGLSVSASDKRTGWTAGLGYEAMVDPNWSWKAEYLYFDLGDETTAVGGVAARESATGHIVRVGLNFRFGS
jgi:outer membrane immunogenic protein